MKYKVDKFRFGQLSLLLAGLGFSYYTAWVILLPFVEPDYQPIVARFGNFLPAYYYALNDRYFPSPAVGLALPLTFGASIFALLLCRAAYLVR